MLTAIRTGLQARDDVLSGSLELIGREREIIRSELGHVQELIELEERRVAAGAGQVPTAQVEPAVAAAEADPEPAAVTPAEPEFATMAEPEPAFAPAAEADSTPTAQAEPDPEFSPTEEPTFVAAAQAEPDATFAPAPEPEVQFAPMAEAEPEVRFAPMAEAEAEPAFAPMAESEAETEPLAPAARYAEMLRRIEVLRHLPVS